MIYHTTISNYLVWAISYGNDREIHNKMVKLQMLCGIIKRNRNNSRNRILLACVDGIQTHGKLKHKKRSWHMAYR